MKVKVVNVKKGPRAGQKVTFTAKGSGKEFSKTTGKDGTFKILLPEGNRYQATYEVFGEKKKYKKISIPARKNKRMKLQLGIKFRMPNKIVLDDVHFNTGESTLRESSFEALKKLKKALDRNESLKVMIAGHTDSRGSDSSNQKLSEARAQSVVDWLVKKGIEKERLKAKGFGERQPIGSNDTPEGRQKNRRTEVRILEK